MQYKYRNLAGSAAVEITRDFSYFESGFSYICFCNTHSTDSCTIDLYSTFNIESPDHEKWQENGHVDNNYTEPVTTTETYYYMKNLTIPSGVTLQLSNTDFHVDNKVTSVYVKLGASSSTVDLAIKGSTRLVAGTTTQQSSSSY